MSDNSTPQSKRGIDKRTLNYKYSYSKNKGFIENKSSLYQQKILNFPLYVGKAWSFDYDEKEFFSPSGYVKDEYWAISKYKNDFKVEKLEDINTPAGFFRTFKIVLNQSSSNGEKKTTKMIWWFAPEVKNIAKFNREGMGKSRIFLQKEQSVNYTRELISYEIK